MLNVVFPSYFPNITRSHSVIPCDILGVVVLSPFQVFESVRFQSSKRECHSCDVCHTPGIVCVRCIGMLPGMALLGV